MVDVDQTLAEGLRLGVLEEGLHEDQVVLLRQNAEMPYDGPVPIDVVNSFNHDHLKTGMI